MGLRLMFWLGLCEFWICLVVGTVLGEVNGRIILVKWCIKITLVGEIVFWLVDLLGC